MINPFIAMDHEIILMPRTKKRVLLAGIAIISIGGFSLVDTLDMNLMFKLYGLLTTCQIGFALFFLSRIRLRLLPKK